MTDPACGKIRYTTRAHARRKLRRMNGTQATGMRPYFCGHCGFWHLGHLSKAVVGGFASRKERYGEAAP